MLIYYSDDEIERIFVAEQEHPVTHLPEDSALKREKGIPMKADAVVGLAVTNQSQGMINTCQDSDLSLKPFVWNGDAESILSHRGQKGAPDSRI